MTCPICHNDDLSSVHRNTVFSSEKSVLRCETCATYMLSPLPGEYELDEYYRDHYSKLDYKHPNAGPMTKMKLFYADMRAHSQFRFIKKHISDLTGKSVIDFGCATGNLLKCFKSEGCTTLGVELGRQSSEFAATTYGLRILRNQIEDALQNIHTPIDLVIFSHSLEHLIDPIEVLSRCFNLLKPGGHLFIELPNSYIGPTRGPLWDEFSDILLDSDHIYNFSHQNIDHLLSRCNFTVEKKRIFRSHRIFPILKYCGLNATVDHILKKKTERLKRYAGISLNTIYLFYLFSNQQETVEFLDTGASWTGTDEWMRVLAAKESHDTDRHTIN